MARHRVTLEDVARRAGVSISTVSRALAGDPQISSTTAARIRELAAELGYVPNIAARTLVNQRSTSLGLVTPDVTDPIHGQVVSGFQQRAAECGYSVVLANGLLDMAIERQALRELIAHQVGGIALMGCVLDSAEIRQLTGDTPVVTVAPENESNARRRVATLRPDDGDGMRQVVDHLLAQGYRTPCYVTGSAGATQAARLHALVGALAARRRPRPLVYRTGGWTGDALAATVERIAADRPDVAICYDDKTALHLMDALRRAGVRVPHEVGVVGFDDIPFAAIANPRLTTVAQQSEQMGHRCVDLLVDAVEQGRTPRSAVLPVRLVVRETTPGPS